MRIRVPEQYRPVFDEHISEIVEPSGRCSAKTTSNEIYAVSLMAQSKYNNVWYCRAEKNDIGTTIFASMVATIQRMGLENIFTWTTSPYKIWCTKTGAICYFSGINGKTDEDVTAVKGFTPQYNSLALAILDEADQTKHQNHITAWESTLARFLLPYGKTIFAYNPPMSRSHWAHKFFGDKVKNGAARIYATWEDIKGLLNIKAIETIEKYKRDDPEYYRYWYLGEPVNFKGMVYPQFRRETHVINVFKYLYDHPNDRVTETILGLDEGTVNDSTCVTVLAIMASGIAVVLDCLEIDPLKIGQQSPAQTSRLLVKFLNETLTKFPFLQYVQRKWIFECAEGGQMLRLQFNEDSGEETYLVKNKSIMGDIKRVRSMLSEKILFFHVDVNVNTIQLIEDIENYVFDDKTGDIKKQQRDDTIDSLEYATKLYYDAPIAMQ
ncbi:MAG: phage terminase large subunit [Clostridia bacterium]|nr:phage terminase large subunit [Clostridia bacterium]